MTTIIISGCNGHMGSTVAAVAADDPEITVSAGFDIDTVENGEFPVYSDPMEFEGTAGVVVDFSVPSALSGLLEYGVSKKIPLVLCTTGYSPGQLEQIDTAAEVIPILRSGNMSLGINLLADLVWKACTVLGEAFDVEIVERHHRRKVDSPSGTALLLANAAASALPYDPQLVFERQSIRQPRQPREIGISAVRGGTIVGVHEVIFAGPDEVIELKHSAASRDVFATGAIKAAKYLAGVACPGLYDMSDVVGSV